MAAQEIVDQAGTPRQQHLFAVFDTEQAARESEQLLVARGLQPQRLQAGADAQALKGPSESAGLFGKVGRLVKGIGGESHEAERYADHLEQGRIVLGVHVPDRETALDLSRLLVEHGAYDITYFRELAIEYMSSEANLRHGISTHSHSNQID